MFIAGNLLSSRSAVKNAQSLSIMETCSDLFWRLTFIQFYSNETNKYFSIWKPYKEPRTTNICIDEEDKLEINVKEARNRKTSCTSLLKGKGMGHYETTTNKNKSEKIDYISPTIKGNVRSFA